MDRSAMRLSRRDWFRLSTAGVVGYSLSGWLESLADDAAQNPQRRRSCILLWMNGGPSQMETFDLKPGHANGGPYKGMDTPVSGIRISEHLPKVADMAKEMAIIRSMSTKEGDHGRATYIMRTGQLPQGPIQYPSIGALIAKELAAEDAELPSFVAISPYRIFSPMAYGSGFLGPQYAPLVVGEVNNFGGQRNQNNYDQALRVQDLDLASGVSTEEADARVDLLRDLERDFVARHPGVATQSHLSAYEKAVKMMKSKAAKAFNLEDESAELRDAYGRNQFGQSCLLARRLVERGVPFIEVSLGGINNGGLGWDTHNDNFNQVKRLSEVLDPAWGTLMKDLKDRGLLDSTLIVWMGEFGRTPKIARGNGRDHWPNSWSTVLAGGGIKGGQVVGKTDAGGVAIEDRPVSVPDFLATICMALGIDYLKPNLSNVNRPIRIVDKAAKPIKEVLA